jgi:hypothetical protein
LQKAGFRGIRLNLATGGVNDPGVGRPRFQAAVEWMKARGWHVQLFTWLAMISAIKDLVMASPVPVVFDHFGGAVAALGVDQPGFADLLELVKSGKVYVKISGAYRTSRLAPDYPDAAPLARALIAANADRIVWGTDWPHPDSVTPPGRQVTDVTPLIPGRDLGAVAQPRHQLAVIDDQAPEGGFGRVGRAAKVPDLAENLVGGSGGARALAFLDPHGWSLPAVFVACLQSRNNRWEASTTNGVGRIYGHMPTSADRSVHRARREKNEIKTGRVTRMTSGASIMPVTTTTASGFCTCDPMPADSAAGNSPTPATTQVISTGRNCSSPVRITALTRSKPSSIN